ncbi:hypothetical protein [Kutzneria kofuensis]
MLASLTRIGATRQAIDKAFAVLGVEPGAMARVFASAPHLRATAVPGVPGLFTASVPMTWLGTRTARDEAYTAFAGVLRQLSEVVRATGGVLVPPALGTAQHPAVLGGDTHTIEVLSPVEQEVLCNLLRVQVPALIALFGRGVTTAGAPRDRVGSRWLAGSRSHLATRFLASTAAEHLDRVKADLRRRDGVALLDRMDVHPGLEPDGTLTVVVRCLDGAATLAGVRTQALLLAALAMQARRMVRDGRRKGNARQRILEDNRARAVADGLRARLVVDDTKPNQRRPDGQGNGSGRRNTAESPAPKANSARDVARNLVRAAAVELRNLDADAEEIAPVLLALDLPDLGITRGTTETDMLSWWSAAGENVLLDSSLAALTDTTPGGPLLALLNRSAPSQTSIVLGSWRSRIAEAKPAQPATQQRQGGRPGRSQRDDRGRNRGSRTGNDRRAGDRRHHGEGNGRV